MSQSKQQVDCAPILWHALARKYQFNLPKDWYKIEGHWLDQIESFQEQPIDCPGRDAKMNNSITRISQCNESYQLCNSLPRSFIVPKDLKDFTLINSMSTVIKDHRVPVITYCCPIEYKRNFILRCASFDQQAQVIDTLRKVVKPLKVLNLSSMAPSLESVESAHKKLRDVCRPGDDQVSNFISKSGKWLNIISKTLKLVKETAKTLLTEASVILIENNDRGWNSLVSSLVQLTLEPHRRTIEGLESLISKEWIYLSGGPLDYTKPDIMFILFLDCIYQIYIQNPTRFEFTSEYLRYLFEAQYIQSASNSETISSIKRGTNGYLSKIRRTAFYTIDNSDMNGHDKDTASYKPSSLNMVDLHLSDDKKSTRNNNNFYNNQTISDDDREHSKLESGYKDYMFNPFYRPNEDSPLIEVYDHIMNMKLWSSLYLRWQTRIKYNCIEETLYFQLESKAHPPP